MLYGQMMKTYSLPKFGIENLQIVGMDKPEPAPGEVLVKFGAASLNYRDYQIVIGEFAPTQALPIVPISDGAGEVEAVGDGVNGLQVGELVMPLFFPEWMAGEALADERKLSSGLEVPGTLREYGIYREHQLVRAAPHLSAAEAACFPCAGLTAWSALVAQSNIGEGDWVLVQGTGGVSLFGLQFAQALGASVIVTSSSDDKLARAREFGAVYGINYTQQPEWGKAAREFTGGRGVDAVLEIGGTGTLQQSIASIRRGGHINIIGYLAGLELGLSVVQMIERNANLHGLSVGNRTGFEQMMAVVAEHEIRPVISQTYAFAEAGEALQDIVTGARFGKLVVEIDD